MFMQMFSNLGFFITFLIPYYHALPPTIPDGSCVHLDNAAVSDRLRQEGKFPNLTLADVWLEATVPEMTIEAAESVRRPVLTLSRTIPQYGRRSGRLWLIFIALCSSPIIRACPIHAMKPIYLPI
jgi:hypothetical protein